MNEKLMAVPLPDNISVKHKLDEGMRDLLETLPSRKTHHIGKYVAAVYDQNWYVGLIESEHEDEYSIKYMHPKNPQGAVH